MRDLGESEITAIRVGFCLAVLVYSGALALYYLLVRGETRLH